MIYLIIFFISTFFSFISFSTKNSRVKHSCAAISVVLPCLLASFRSPGVGTDTNIYIGRAFDLARYSKDFFSIVGVMNLEEGYMALNFLVSRFSGNVHIMYFVLQFIIQFFVYKSCENFKETVPTWFSYLTFLLLYYNRSLNMCRQTLSLVLVLFSYKLFKEKHYFKWAIIILISTIFHRTALLAIPMFFLIKFIDRKKTLLKKIIVVTSLIVGIMLYSQIINFLVNNGILSSRYLFYVNGGTINIIKVELFQKWVVVISILFFYKHLKNIPENKTLIFVLLLDFVIYHLGYVANYAQRISYYFGYFNIFIIPQFYRVFYGKKTKKLIGFLIIMVLIIYWWYYYGFLGADETIPYMSPFF